MRRIEARWFGTNLGWGPWLNAAIEYETSLRNFFGSDLSCNRTFDILEEGVYPIDLTRKALSRLTSDPMDDLLPQIDADLDQSWIRDGGGTLRLLFLGANSD